MRDHIALLTGAASGIGAATARMLASKGVGGLVLVDRAAGQLGAVAAQLGQAKVLQRVHDVADEVAWAETGKAVQATFGRLDFAVANAGISDAGAIAEFSFERWRRKLFISCRMKALPSPGRHW